MKKNVIKMGYDTLSYQKGYTAGKAAAQSESDIVPRQAPQRFASVKPRFQYDGSLHIPVCNNCNKILNLGDNYCPACGSYLTWGGFFKRIKIWEEENQ